MSDLIRREDAIKAINKALKRVFADKHIGETIIGQVPSADRPQGEWIDMGDFEQCSVCKGTHLKEFQSYYGKTTWIKTSYCPNCGCRMKGADDE